MIDIENLNIKYKTNGEDIWAVRDVNVKLKDSTSYGIVGESGSGKTTFAMGILRLLNDKLTDMQGEILYEGKNLVEMKEGDLKKYRWVDFAVVFQESMNSFSPVHKIKTQFEDVYRVHFPKTSSKQIEKQALELMEKFGLSKNVYRSYPHELSGGMLQRVTIVLALLLRPKVLVLDEATTALDLINERQILEEIKEIDFVRLNITHDISVVHTSCQEVIVMYGGHIVEMGRVKEVFSNPRHPYTKGLLDSYPDISKRNKETKSIEGSLPDLSKEYSGCIYRSRCPRAIDKCKNIKPNLTEEKTRSYYCHNPLGD